MLLVITNSGGGVKLGEGIPRNNGIFAIVTQEFIQRKGKLEPTTLNANMVFRKSGVTQSLERIEANNLEELLGKITAWVERRRNDKRSSSVLKSS